MGKAFTFVFGLVTGVALILLIEGPFDTQLIQRQVGAGLQKAGRGARDIGLATTVRGALALQKDFDLFGGISVDADGDQVTLTGTVGSRDQRELAELIARGVEGVEHVINDLEIQRDQQ